MPTMTIRLTPGCPSDVFMARLAASDKVVPMKLGSDDGRDIEWPHALVRCTGPSKYEVERIDACPCGKPMYPLPFNCDDCLSCAFRVGP